MILGQGMQPVLIGSILGFIGAYSVSGFFKSLLFGVGTADLSTYISTAAVLGAVALCACTAPASRAIRVDPMVALRHE
jgi:ABC-type antimicrobial peptide transport system permease subunit